MNRGAQELSITVVPDSGTGELTDFTGETQVLIGPDERHSYEFDYTIQPAAGTIKASNRGESRVKPAAPLVSITIIEPSGSLTPGKPGTHLTGETSSSESIRRQSGPIR